MHGDWHCWVAKFRHVVQVAEYFDDECQSFVRLDARKPVEGVYEKERIGPMLRFLDLVDHADSG